MKLLRAPLSEAHTRGRYLIPALILLSAVRGALSASPSTDPLWQKAVEIARRNKSWAPGNATFRLELTDANGTTQESWESWYRLAPDADGNVVMEVVRALRNGEDSTQKEKEAQEKRNAEARKKGTRQPFTMGDDPFDPLAQGSVEANPIGQRTTIRGRDCALYDFRLTRKDGAVLKGSAWLDVETGAPVEASYRVAPLPRGIFEMKTTMTYGEGPIGDGCLKEALVEGVGGILFIRRSFRTIIAVDGYWRR